MMHHTPRGHAAPSRPGRSVPPAGALPLAAFSAALLASAGAVVAAPMNLAPLGTATASSEGFGAVASDGNDGDRNGAYGAGSVFHSQDPDTAAFYVVDLGDSYYIDRVQVLPRTDARQGSVTNFRLSVLADDGSGNPGAAVFERSYLPTAAANYAFGTTDPGAAAPGGARGRFVRLDRLGGTPPFLTFAEFEVLGQSTPLRGNLASGRAVTSSAPGFGATAGSGVDGNIDGDFYHPGTTVYHSAVSAAGQFYEVDLGGTVDLDYLELFDRGDADTTTQFLVTVLDDARAEVFSTVVDSAGPLNYDHTLDLTDVAGRYLRLETTRAEFLAFAEVRAFAVPEPGAAGLVLACAPLALARRRRGRGAR